MPEERTRNSFTFPIVAVLLIILAAGAWFIYNRNINQPDVEVLTEQFEWTLSPRATAQGTTTDVTLRIAGVDVPVRTLPGTCELLSSTGRALLENELSGVICLDEEGNGSEIGVFQEGEDLVIMQGEVMGSQRTNFVEIQQGA